MRFEPTLIQKVLRDLQYNGVHNASWLLIRFDSNPFYRITINSHSGDQTNLLNEILYSN
jgi:hypothetical protein